MSGRGSPGSSVGTPEFSVSKIRRRTGLVGPAKGLRPVCCTSIWYCALAGCPLRATGEADATGLAAAAGDATGTGELAATGDAPGSGEAGPTPGLGDRAGAVVGGAGARVTWMGAVCCWHPASNPTVSKNVTVQRYAFKISSLEYHV